MSLRPNPVQRRERKAWTSKQVADVTGDGAFAAVGKHSPTPDIALREHVIFACGCVVNDAAGQWKACESAWHQLLACEPFHSQQTRRFLQSRALFHEILRAAWLRNAPHWPTRRQEIQEVYHVTPETFYLNHDLTDRWIMNADGELEAQLETIPGVRTIHLYNGGSIHRPHIVLHAMIDRRPEPIWLESQDLSPEEAIATILDKKA